MPHNNIPNMHNTYCCKCRTKVLGPFNSYLRGYRCVSCAATYSHLLLRSFQSIFRYRVFFLIFCRRRRQTCPYALWTISRKISFSIKIKFDDAKMQLIVSNGTPKKLDINCSPSRCSHVWDHRTLQSSPSSIVWIFFLS